MLHYCCPQNSQLNIGEGVVPVMTAQDNSAILHSSESVVPIVIMRMHLEPRVIHM